MKLTVVSLSVKTRLISLTVGAGAPELQRLLVIITEDSAED